MQLRTELEQHIAVFGESGSGKTVLLSSFYGATQQPHYLQTSLFHVVPGDTGQGNRLLRNYLGMRDSARLPEITRFSATSYSFSIKLKNEAHTKPTKSRPFNALRLVWHDYPGEWFEEEVSGPEEAQRRVDTFRSLLGSDVALLLVDGQRLLDNAGEEERYLKSLLANFRNGLLSIRDDLLQDGQPLVEFPRIWIMALSKSDLLPDMSVFTFRDLLIEKACDDIEELRNVLGSLVEARDALAFGEDFMLLSSAKFGTDKIEVTKRVGLEMVLPLAAVLPFERHVRWAQTQQIPAKVAANLMRGAAPLATTLIGYKAKLPGRIGDRLLRTLNSNLINEAAKLAADKLTEINAQALARHDYLTATLTQFRLDLINGEKEQILLTSP